MNKQKKNIFITGATGFLGSNLLKTLLVNKENRVYVLIRTQDNRSILQRKNILINKTFSKPMRREVVPRIHIIRGDISKDNLGLSKKDLGKLRNTINMVYHCAAICKFSYGLDAIRRVNVRGTENLLKLGLNWQNIGCLENINHISTAYIAGNYTGTFYEQETDVSQRFNNTYEQSKFEAELAVLKYRKRGLRVDVYRPSIIIDTIPPDTNVIISPMWLLAMFILKIFKKIPADNATELNMVPVDTVSKAIYLISTTKNRSPSQNYHIVNPGPVKFCTLLKMVSTFFGFKKPECVPVARFRIHKLNQVQRRIIQSLIPYLNQKLSFDMKNAASILKEYDFTIPLINKERLIKTFEHYRSFGLVPERCSYAVKEIM